ncbi:hypothetical protein EVA_17123, partial [gut metagenome]
KTSPNYLLFMQKGGADGPIL